MGMLVVPMILKPNRFVRTPKSGPPVCTCGFHSAVVSGGMKVVESWRFEIPFSSAAFSSDPSR
jgi:hypothetical protein